MRGEGGGQQKVNVLFTFENVENVGRSLTTSEIIDIHNGTYIDETFLLCVQT